MIHPSHEGRNSIHDIVEHHKKRGLEKYYGTGFGEPDKVEYGLEVYHAKKYSKDLYLYRPNGEAKVYIKCTGEVMNVPSPGCKMEWDYTEKVYAEATFSMNYLPIWQEIVNNIEMILQGQEIQVQGETDGIAYH
jgi:hypothetical protein